MSTSAPFHEVPAGSSAPRPGRWTDDAPAGVDRSYEIRGFELATETEVSLTVEATHPDLARALAQGRGIVVLDLRLQADRTGPTRRGARLALDIPAWCRELRTLVDAGMSVSEALDTLRLQDRPQAQTRLHDELVRGLRQGRRLSDAMADTGAFPPLLLAGVRAGERTSGLVVALDDYLRHAESMARLTQRARHAALYPGLVAGLGLVITVFLLVGVVPRFAHLYGDLTALSTPTRLLLGVSRLLVDHGASWAAAGAVGGLALALAWHMERAAWLQHGVQGLTRRVADWAAGQPGLRGGIRDLQRARLYQSLALMVRGGYTLDEALAECRRWSPGTRMAEGIGTALASLRQGRPVSASLSAGQLTDTVALRLLAVAERSGGFDRVLQAIADRHAQRFGHYLDRVSRLVEPLLLLGVALFVGALVVLMYMPVFDMAGVLP